MALLKNRHPDQMDKYQCIICQDLLIEPVTVNCGHTFCHLCLAKWTLQCGVNKCAHCSQMWTGQPRVNIMLRETIQERFPDAYQDRVEQQASQMDVIRRFDNHIQTMVQRQQQPLQPPQELQAAGQRNLLVTFGFMAGAIIAIAFGLLIYLLGFRPSQTYINKSVKSWNLMDCMHWLDSMGDLTKAGVIPKLASHQLDGQFIMELATKASSNDDLVADGQKMSQNHSGLLPDILLDESKEHQLLMRKAFKYILVNDKVPPSDLWQYQATYPLKSRVYIDVGFAFPRFTILVMYIFDYKDSFLPLMHSVTGSKDISLYETEFPALTTFQYLDFLLRFAFLPLWTIYTKFIFIALWTTNFWSMLYISLGTGFAAVHEISFIFQLLTDSVIISDPDPVQVGNGWCLDEGLRLKEPQRFRSCCET